MADKRDLLLNSVDRYVKRSPDLALEEYSHCEVPAGCGGVVLRWIDLREAVPLTLWLYTATRCELYVDGETPRAMRVLLPHGEHVIALAVEAPAEGGAFLFAALYDPGAKPYTREPVRTGNVGERMALTSQADGRWRATMADPGGVEWRHRDYDDAGWFTLTERPTRAPDKGASGSWRFKEVMELGGRPLGQRGKSGMMWVRRTFTVSGSGLR